VPRGHPDADPVGVFLEHAPQALGDALVGGPGTDLPVFAVLVLELDAIDVPALGPDEL
jgi:hypothetical protein